MSSNKSEQIKDPIWDQHLKWLDLVNNECKSNQVMREREKCRQELRQRNPEDIARPCGLPD